MYQQQIVRNDAEASIDKAAHYAELWNHTGSAEAEEPAMKRKRLTSTSTAFQRKWTAQQLHRFDYLDQLSLHEPGKPFNLQTEQDILAAWNAFGPGDLSRYEEASARSDVIAQQN